MWNFVSKMMNFAGSASAIRAFHYKISHFFKLEISILPLKTDCLLQTNWSTLGFLEKMMDFISYRYGEMRMNTR